MTTMSIEEIEAHNRICAAEDILDVPLVECRPWCEAGDGHPHEIFRDNQICCSPELRIEMTLADPVEMVVRRGELKVPDSLSVYAEQAPESAPRILIEPMKGTFTALTVAEVQRLIEALHLILGQVAA